MAGVMGMLRRDWWACRPRRGGEWFAEYAVAIFGFPILALRHHVLGPFRTAHGACCECERQMRKKRAEMLGYVEPKKGILS